MPLNVRRYYTSVLLVLLSFVFISRGQTVTPPVTNPQQTPTSGDMMRDRISKAKAYIAVRNYNAAVYELENIRKESGDVAVQSVVNVLLMNSYLEQGDFKRAQDFLNEFYNIQKTTKPNAAASYASVAGQVIRSARDRADRYKALGLKVSDRTLPLEALNDLEKMRETLEIVITQSKEIVKTPARASDGMGLLEEATTSRSMLARDEYDARHWTDEVADTREQMANSRSVVLSAVGDDTGTKPEAANTNQVAANVSPAVLNTPAKTATPSVYQPISDAKINATRDREVKTPSDTTLAANTQTKNGEPIYVPSALAANNPAPTVKEEPKPTVETPKSNTDKSNPAKTDNVKPDAPKIEGPIEVGPLLAYATKQTAPVYPITARTLRATGIVRVDVTVDEAGDVTEVQKTSGPSLLQGAAKDAIKKWKFRPFVRGGQPVKANGYVNFNFSL